MSEAGKRVAPPKDEVTTGLPAVVNAATRLLVLGSLPSRKSIELQQYYGNPQNVFWRIMADLAVADAQLSYPERLRQLGDAGIGLWDVLAAAVRPGSLDARIDSRTARCNDFSALLAAYPAIQRIAFNGKTAARLFRQDQKAMAAVAHHGVELADLPSTSPAHAAMAFDEKCRRWREALVFRHEEAARA
ncbi:MAG: DNA-deoxyinosine glycosylase [Pseudomonadota bacterium]